MQISATDIFSDSHSLTGTLHACVFGFIDGAVGLGFQSVNANLLLVHLQGTVM